MQLHTFEMNGNHEKDASVVAMIAKCSGLAVSAWALVKRFRRVPLTLLSVPEGPCRVHCGFVGVSAVLKPRG